MSDMNQRNSGTNTSDDQQSQDPTTPIERSAQPGHNAVARDDTDRTLLNAQDMAPGSDPDAGQLEAFGDDEITTDRIHSILGREMQGSDLSEININTQAGGVVYLRGTVRSAMDSQQIEMIIQRIKGVGEIVNELNVQRESGM